MTPAELRTSPKKRARRPQARSLPLRRAILAVAAEYDRMSVRQLFYQLVTRGVVEKTEQVYKRVADAAVQLRLSGELDYRAIADGHRERRGPRGYDGLTDALDDMHRLYRRNYWRMQPLTVEVWCEKDALSGIIHPVCAALGVTYVAVRGFPSVTLKYESARALAELGKPAIIYYFGDHDSAGRAISAGLEADLRAHGARVTVKRLALEPAQIERYRLPTRPNKSSDSRHRAFVEAYGDAAVELDALPPNVLTTLVENCIRHHIEPRAWAEAQRVEALERETLASIARLPLAPGTRYGLAAD